MMGSRRPSTFVRAGLGLLLLAGVPELALAVPAHAGGPVVVKSAHNPTHGNIVVDTKGLSLYLLSSEAKSNLTCNVVCSVFWPPLTVPAGTTQVSGGPGVKGKLGLIKRPEGSTQVTYNGYPLYRYVSDSSPGDTKGQGITSFGGTWYLVSPSATTPASTPNKTG